MGEIIVRKVKGMNWTAKISLVLIFALVFSTFMHQGWYAPKQAAAAVTQQIAWTSGYNAAAFPTSFNVTVTAGTNRMLVVAVSSTISAAATQNCTVTYGGTALTLVRGDGSISAQQHTWLFYLPENATLMNNTARPLVATVTGGTAVWNTVAYAVYNSVDQGPSPIRSSDNYNSGATAGTAAALPNGVTIQTGDVAVGIVNLSRTGSTTTRTLTAATNWTSPLTNGSGTAANPAVNRYMLTSTTAGTSTAPHTASGTCLISHTAMVIKQFVDLTVGNGTNPSNLTVGASSTNNPLDAFTLRHNTGTGTVTSLVVTGTGSFTSTNIPTNGVKVWRDLGTVGAYDPGVDVQVSTASTAIAGNATTVTISSESVTTTAQNYLVTVDITATPGIPQSFTGTVTSVTGTGIALVDYTDTSSATLTTGNRNLTIADGTNPPNEIAQPGSINNAIDGFTMGLTATGSGSSVTSLTIRGSANFTATNIPTNGVKVWRDTGTDVGYWDGGDTLISGASTAISANQTTVTIASEALTSPARNYLVTVDITAGATLGQSFTATVTAATGIALGTPTYADGTSATITVNKLPSDITSCGSCHGYPPLDGTRSGVSGAVVGDHQKHDYVCLTCHVAPATETPADFAHRNGLIQMQANISGGTYSKGTSFAQTNSPVTGTCSNISCHGGNNPTPQWGVGTAGCVNCHNGTITRTAAAGTLDNVVAEFGLAWGHKKTGRGAVTNADCIVCHLEGNFTTQATSATLHGNGNIDLRDPDGVGEAAITNISGGAFTFQKFSVSFAAGSRTTNGHLSNTDIANVVTQKFCIACHDNNGATNTTARTAGGTAFMPWGGVNLGANYTVANGAAVAGGLVDVRTQFAVTNSSYHPVLGPLTRDFPYSTRLAVPYNNIATTRDANGTTGHATAVSVVINCFDCHNTPTPVTNRTISAHGNAVTLRGTIYAFNAASTLCTACHTGYTVQQNHGTGSAWAATGSSHNIAINCQDCHGSYQNTSTAPPRPLNAQNYHGNNALVGGGLWPTVNSRPYGFIRAWSGTAYHRPFRATEFTTGSATCGVGTCPTGGMGGQVGDGSTRTYTPGGTY